MATRRGAKRSSAGRAAKGNGIDLRRIGGVVFLLGLLVAILLATVPGLPQWTFYVLLVTGLLSGAFFVRNEDETHFLVLSVALNAVSSQFSQFSNGPLLSMARVINFLSFYLVLAVVSLFVSIIVRWVRGVINPA